MSGTSIEAPVHKGSTAGLLARQQRNVKQDQPFCDRVSRVRHWRTEAGVGGVSIVPAPTPLPKADDIVQRFDTEWTPFTPVAPERVTAGQPSTRLAETVTDDGFHSGLWEVTPGRFTTAPNGFDEVIHIISGSGVLRSAEGDSVELAPGVSFLMEDGFIGEWEIREPLRKFYAKVRTAITV